MSSGTTRAGPEELEGLSHDAQLTAFLAGSFVLPTIELETPLDVDGTSFLAIFSGNLRLSPPEGDIDKGGLLTFLTTLGSEDAVDGYPEISDGTSLGCVFDFGITGDIPDQHHFVEIGHWIEW
jgi:hypothetical protein